MHIDSANMHTYVLNVYIHDLNKRYLDLMIEYFGLIFLLTIYLYPGIVQLSYEDNSMNGSLKIEPGQYMYLSLPSISTIEWHPFTVSSKIGTI
jgi:hypothetical protein